MSNPSSTDTVVAITLLGTAAANGVDYTVLSGTVTIPAGATSVNIPVAITDDNIVEGSETLVLTLTNVTGDPDITLSTTAADLTAQTEILDNDTQQSALLHLAQASMKMLVR